MAMWFINLEKLLDIPIFKIFSSNALRDSLKRDMIHLFCNILHVWLSTLLQLAITLPSLHARWQLGHSTIWRHPLKFGNGRRTSDPCTISFLSYPLLLLYSYSDCSPIIEYTSDRWIQFVLFNTLCYTCFYYCICHRGCCREVGEGNRLFTLFVS